MRAGRAVPRADDVRGTRGARAGARSGSECNRRWQKLPIQLSYEERSEFVMPTRNVNLTVEQDAFVEELVTAGKYQNASEAVRDALRGLQQRLKTDELKLDLLRTQLQAGLDPLERRA